MPIGAIGGPTTAAVNTDPRDLNQDGKVTEQEIQRYNRIHPDRVKEPPQVSEQAIPSKTGLVDQLA